MNIKILCTDLDGTLLHSDKTISSYTLSVLKKITDAGIILVPVTGRHLGGIPSEIKEQGIKYAICSNGAGLYDFENDKLLREESIPDDIMKYLLKKFVELDIMADIFTSDNAYTDNRNLDILNDVDASEAVKAYIRNSRVITDDIETFYINKRPSVQKLTINFRKTGSEYKNRDKIREILSGFNSFEFVTGGANNIEITSRSATKGLCIEYLSDMTGIPVSEIAAIGDTENDLSMLRTAGISIAMKNADKEVKDICRFITEYTNDEDGAARFFEKNILI